jgi:two-component system cell cycle response regulator
MPNMKRKPALHNHPQSDHADRWIADRKKMGADVREEGLPVLIAEDNPVGRRLLEKSLVKAGHEVVTASNGREAFALFKERFFPIVLTDWMMPEMDGVQLCRAIRGHQTPGYVFIVFLTSKDTKEDIVAALDAGADDYLTKPFHQAELMARIKTGKRILGLERSLMAANEDIKMLSITDALTGSYNRGYLMTRLPEEVSRARRYGHPLSVIMCDIDHFKEINDSCGHAVGDAVLQNFVTCLNETIRHEVDWIARYGGEEFVVILSDTALDGAIAVAERLRKSLAERIMQVEGRQTRITASFGVATLALLEGEAATSDDLIKEADRCLYQAKEQGRNRVNGR